MSIIAEILPNILPNILPSPGDGSILPWKFRKPGKYKIIRITVRYKNKTWVESYKVLEELTGIIIRVTSVINRVINKISFTVVNIVSTFRNFRIKR